MQSFGRFLILLDLALAAIVLSPLAARAAEPAGAWPLRPVHFMVGTLPGGSVDIVARILGPTLSEALGQQVIVENRAGAGGVIASELVARAAPDGYMILFAYSSHTSAPFLIKNISYDAIRSFTPITQLAKGPSVLVANPSLPVNTVPELIEYARKNPGKLNFGVPTTGSSGHLQAEYFKQLTGLQITSVMYKGGSEGALALMGGVVQLYFMPVAATIPQIKQGKMKLIAAASRKRLPYLPDTPTLEEAGFKGFDDLDNWQGLLGPAKLPAAVVNRLYTESAKALKLPDTIEKLAKIGSVAIGSAPDEFARQLERETEQLGKIIKAAGMEPQ